MTAEQVLAVTSLLAQYPRIVFMSPYLNDKKLVTLATKTHNIDIWEDGGTSWYSKITDEIDRCDGPAYVCVAENNQKWYIDGVEYMTEKEYAKKIKSIERTRS